MLSFLVDQLPLCSTEGASWIAILIIDMMLQRPDLQASAQVLKPLVLHFSSTYSPLAAHVVFLLEVSYKWPKVIHCIVLIFMTYASSC